MPNRARNKTATTRKTADQSVEREVSFSPVDMNELPVARGIAIDEDGHVRGVADARIRVGPYGASDAIRRGAADAIRPQLADSPPEAHTCVCGCGARPSSPMSLFMPGHDSKVRKMGLMVLRGELKQKQLTKAQNAYLTTAGFWERAAKGGVASHVIDEQRA